MIELLREILQYLQRTERRLEQINRNLEQIGRNMATQADINALSARIDSANLAFTTGLQGVRDDIAALKAANPGVDTTALEASVSALEADVSGLTELDSENPAPAGP